MKCVSIIGIPKPLEAIINIAAVERPEDRDHSFTRQDWKCDEANHQRGVDWLDKLYKYNRPLTENRVEEAHKDFGRCPFSTWRAWQLSSSSDWLCKEIVYGLFLSDRQVLDDVDTEMVVLSGIMIQNLKHQTGWHLRGTRRIGVSQQDVETIHQCVSKQSLRQRGPSPVLLLVLIGHRSS